MSRVTQERMQLPISRRRQVLWLHGVIGCGLGLYAFEPLSELVFASTKPAAFLGGELFFSFGLACGALSAAVAHVATADSSVLDRSSWRRMFVIGAIGLTTFAATALISSKIFTIIHARTLTVPLWLPSLLSLLIPTLSLIVVLALRVLGPWRRKKYP